jgi:hypothetical protein
MQRAGTTLLEKLLAGHSQVSLLSQPFPYLFLHVKRDFYRSLGVEPPPYPLGPLFREAYEPDEFARFLASYTVEHADIEAAFSAMEGYSGQYTRFEAQRLRATLRSLSKGDLAGTVAQLYRLLARDPRALWCGGKETLCEEFAPFLLDRGIRVVVILRDPRDVLASLNHGRGERFAGKLKPTLFNLRNWRKSVAFALHLQHHPGFHWLRYEDLVAKPRTTLGRIARFLAIEPFPAAATTGRIRDEQGRSWRGNSSYGEVEGITVASVGRYRDVLPDEVQAFVEAACFHELAHLGYPCERSRSELQHHLRSFREPYPMERSELLEYLPSPRSITDELGRLAALEEGTSERTREYFVFDDVAGHLRSSGSFS